jgi:diguanylate cyclase (GGDEF)-like protein
LTTIIHAICDSEGWDLGRYFSLDEAACVMRLDTSWGKPGGNIARFLADTPDLFFRPAEGLVGAAWHASEPLWIADASADPRVKQRALALETGMHAAFVFPVRAGGNTVGVLAFWSHRILAPDARLLQAVRVIGGQIGHFMVRDAQQRHIARLNRIQVVLSGINQLIVRVGNRAELFREACRVAVEDGHFALAWLGMVERKEMRLKMVASHDTTQGYVDLIPLGLDQFAPGGLGLAGRAVWERHAIIANDIAGGSQLHILKDEALARGLRSMVALPLKVGNEVIGVLSLYSTMPNFFDSEEMKLLLELAGDIAFALDHLEQADRLDHLAYYDPLTGLANRRLFEERLGQLVSETAREGARLAVLMYDVVHFKTINDTFGRLAGDDLLKQIVERATGDTPVADRTWLARLGGDQFVSFIPGVENEGDVGRRLELRLHKVMGVPFRVGDADLRIAVKVGIAIYPEDGRDTETLLKNAEVALKRAKASPETYLFFNPAMSARVADKLMLENQLRQAVEKQEFVLHYQPKLDLDSGRIVGAEALIRWQSPSLGLVPPLQFVSLLEETGLIQEVGRWALRQAVLDYGRLAVRGLSPPRIAVNVSPLQLRRADFVDTLRTVLAHGPGKPGIDLEITESVVMDDVAGNIAKLKEVRELGVGIAIDDFGTGYSSLAYLARLPVQTLKIDRSFIITMLAEPDTMTLVATMISLAHSLRLKVVAEGVDAEEQAKMLRLLRCDQMQGYLFSKPLPLEALAALLQRHGK